MIVHTANTDTASIKNCFNYIILDLIEDKPSTLEASQNTAVLSLSVSLSGWTKLCFRMQMHSH